MYFILLLGKKTANKTVPVKWEFCSNFNKLLWFRNYENCELSRSAPKPGLSGTCRTKRVRDCNLSHAKALYLTCMIVCLATSWIHLTFNLSLEVLPHFSHHAFYSLFCQYLHNIVHIQSKKKQQETKLHILLLLSYLIAYLNLPCKVLFN